MSLNRNTVIRFKRWKSFAMERNIYFRTMSPVLIIGIITAILPFSINKNGECGFHWTSLIILYDVIVYVCIGQNELFFIIHLMKEIFEDEQYNMTVLRTPALLMAMYTLMTPIIHWTSINRIGRYWQKWDIFQEKMEKCYGSCPVLTRKRYTLLTMLILGTFNMIMAVVGHITTERLRIGHASWHWLLSSFEIYYITSLWIINCSFIGNYAQHSIGKLKQAMGSRNTSPEMFRNMIEVWLELSKQLDNYAESYAPIFLSTMCLLIILIAVTAYILILLHHIKGVRLLIIALSSVIWLSSCYAACDIAHRTNEKMTFNMQKAILKNNMMNLQAKLQHEVVVFLKSIKTRNPKLSIGYILSTDRTLFLSIFSNIMMYLIVLRQIGISI